MREKLNHSVALLLGILLWGLTLSPVLTAQATGTLTGTLKDSTGAIVTGKPVTLESAQGGQILTATTNAQGLFEFHGVAPGAYTVSVNVPGFAPYASGVEIQAGPVQRLNIALAIANVSEDVQVTADAPHVNISSENNTSSVTINTKNLDAFSDDPDELQTQLLALAGPSVGPNGGQLYVDGFTVDAGSLPPKNSIREIRVNQNPFSAEYDRLGYGRVEILTKPGSNAWHGRFTGNGNDLALDTKDPFASSEPGYYSLLATADLSGPLGKNGSFYFDYQHRNIENNAVVDAIEPGGNFNQTLAAPDQLDVTGPRFDFALGANNILTVSYQYSRQYQQNLGIGQFSLQQQGYNLYSLQNILRVKDTQIVGLKFVNDLSYQGQDQLYMETPVSTAPLVSVAGSFTGGGNSLGDLNYHHHHNEVDDVATLSLAKHTVTFGGRLREVTEPYVSPGDFNGAFNFASLSAYQAGTPNQFTLTVGNPLTRVFSEDTGVFITDDWRAAKNLMLSYGLRFETQNFISDEADWGPRFGVAWGIGRKSNPAPKTVLRAGFGIFYDRFNQQLQLQAEELNGVNQAEYVDQNPNPAFFTMYPQLPTVQQLLADGAVPAVYQVQPNLHAPYTIQEAIGAEQQVSKAVTVSVTYLNSRGDDQLISDNINAPLPGTYNPSVKNSGTRPNPLLGNVYQYQSSAIFRQNQLITNANVRASSGLSLFGTYTLSHANSDTSGAGSFPDNQYDIAEDYGRAGFDIRNRVVAGGTISLPYRILLSPLLNFQSGAPYNYTVGQDLTGSTIFNQRPSLATASTPGAILTPIGYVNPNPGPNDTLVPINVGRGPSNFVFNLRAGKTFAFGKEGGRGGSVASMGDMGGAGPGGGFRPGTNTQASGGGNLGGRGLGGGGGGGGGRSINRRYSFTVNAEARNLFNDVNLAPPIGTITSRKFGQSNATTGGVYSFSGTNRRIDLQVVFNF